MHLHRLNLVEFRSIRRLELEIPAGGFGLIGANASGKSTLLEAIALLSTSRSPRATFEREMIHWLSGQELGVAPFSRVEGLLNNSSGDHLIEIGLESEGPRTRRIRKVISLDGKRTRASKIVGLLKCVLFEPPDIDLVAGSPTRRRKYLDILLSQLEPAYLVSLSRYTRIVEQRNSLLKLLIKDGQSWNAPLVRSQLDFWDNELVAHGSRIVHRRLDAVDRVADFARARLNQFTGGSDLAVEYVPATSAQDPHGELARTLIDAGKRSAPELAFAMSELLVKSRQDEFRRGVTLIGPHRDDLAVLMDAIDVGTFGSRGQQRLSAIALKLAEADVMTAVGGERPIILLDDVFSELDQRHRHLLSRSVNDLGAQVVVTSTDAKTLEEAALHLPALATIEFGAFRWST